MFRTYLGRVVSLCSVIAFLLALVVLRNELHETTLSDIAAAAAHMPRGMIVASVILIALNYLILTGYDVLALRYLGKKIPYYRVALSSFICHVFSNNLGASLIVGGSVRYRLYHSKGLTGVQVLEFVSFCLLTFWLGFLTLAGVVFTVVPPHLPPHSILPFDVIRPLGLWFLALVGAYLVWTSMRKQPICIRGCALHPPSPELTVVQILVASFEWFIGAFILSLLLPPNALPYPHLLGLFLIAHLVGLASQVPGGLGVFESMIVALLPPSVPLHVAAASLILYRCIHNLLPLIAAAILFGLRELRNGGKLMNSKFHQHGEKNKISSLPPM